jgi:hypothetical protein
MKNRYQIIIILLVVIISACKKELNRQSSSPFAGKVKTITDNSIPNGLDSIYLFYDNTTGNLKNVYIKRVNTFLRDTSKYYISVWYNDNIINFKIDTNNNNDTTGPHTKITTNNKQITSIEQVNFDNTEILTRSIHINSNHVDSIFDIGSGIGGYISNIHSNDFRYSNGNCEYYTSFWTKLYNPIGPVFGNEYDTLNFYYNNQINTQMLLYQQPLEMNTNKSIYINPYWFMLDLLQTDGYYILPRNNNLIDSFTNTSFTTKYLYEFDTNNRIIKVKQKIGFGTAGETEKEQHMTYY